MDHGFVIDALRLSQTLPVATEETDGNIAPSVTIVAFTAPATSAHTWYCTQPRGPGHPTMTSTLVVLPNN